MNLEPEFAAKPPEGPGGFLSLAILSLLTGAVAGLVGAIFRLSLDQADRFRDAMITWAHGEKLAGFLLIAATCTAAASRPPQELVVERRAERLAVQLTVPPAGFLMCQAAPGRDHLSSSQLEPRL